MNSLLLLSRLTINPLVLKNVNVISTNIIPRGISTGSSLLFRATPCLFAEPLKKKKKLDPSVIRAREERKKKKIERQIKRLEKNARQLKPIDECEVPHCIVDDKKLRERKLSTPAEPILESRILLEKRWATYRNQEHLKDIQIIDKIVYSQQRALDELRKESEELYQEAIQMDNALIPFQTQGPVNTQPIEDYNVPDGEYLDVSRKW